MIINNRQVNLWRGTQEPPTKYHIWIKDNKLLLYDGDEWVVFIDHFSGLQSMETIKKQLEVLNAATVNNKKIIDNPVLSSIDLLVNKDLKTIKASDSVQRALEILDTKFLEGYDIVITEEDAGVVISIGGHSFKLIGNNTINISKSGNNIIIDSSALSTIETSDPLEWTKDKTLIHKNSGVKKGIYGTANNQTRVNSFDVPKIEVNETGHITNAENISITIRDYVEQKQNNNLDESKPLLLAYNDAESKNPVIIANGLKFNNKELKLETPGTIAVGGGIDINGGDLVVKEGYVIKGKLEGQVVGTATPKIHLSEKTEYGVASTSLYGHVIIADDLGLEAPLPSNINKDKNKQDLLKGVQAVAASPLMVWNAREDAKTYAEEYSKGLFGEDFEADEKGKYNLKWENI